MNKAVRELYEELSPIRTTVSTLENDCLVITYSELIQDALTFYEGKIDSFFILDKFNHELKDFDFKGYKALGKDSVEYLLKHEKPYCYVRPVWDFWQYHGLWPLTFELEAYKKDFSFNIPTEIIDPVRPSFGGRIQEADYIENRFEDVEKIYLSLADNKSKKCYLGIIKALATGDPGYISLSEFSQYLHPSCLPEVGDTVIDGGLETAATPIMFAGFVKELGDVIGFEPVPAQAVTCRSDVAGRNNITIVEKGLSSGKGHFFIHGSGAGSFLSHDGFEGAIECSTTDIDSWCIENGKSPTLIKLDVEGSEQAALRGAKFVLDNYQPKVMISLYHRVEDYIDIPLFFINKYPDYSLYIGHHSPWWNETILYGVPKNTSARYGHAANQLSYIERTHVTELMNAVLEKLEAQQKRIDELCDSNHQMEDILRTVVPLLKDNHSLGKEVYSCLLSTEYEHMPLYRFIWRSIKRMSGMFF